MKENFSSLNSSFEPETGVLVTHCKRSRQKPEVYIFNIVTGCVTTDTVSETRRMRMKLSHTELLLIHDHEMNNYTQT